MPTWPPFPVGGSADVPKRQTLLRRCSVILIRSFVPVKRLFPYELFVSIRPKDDYLAITLLKQLNMQVQNFMEE